MSEMNMNQNVDPATGQSTGERTFTQDQVNAIVGKRLAEAKASSEAELKKREKELNEREMKLKATELLTERGLPKTLADVLRYDDENSLISAIDVLTHVKGFKEEKKEEEPRITVLENRLPERQNNDMEHDPIRNAMGLK
ncbi:MAG: hypothetical protein Q4E73_11315 [Lachnospiraceae bacterium]|nr:hypothetical protein [Lachnospiraceae bacterium]